MNFLKKVLIGVILITFIAAAWTLTARIDQVDKNQGLEIVLDGKAYTELKSLAPTVTLQKLKTEGVTALAVYQQNLEELLELGSLKKIEVFDFSLLDPKLQSELKNEGVDFLSSNNSALFLIFKPETKQQLKNMESELEKKYSAKIIETGAYNFLYFSNWHRSLEDLNLGYNMDQVRQAQELDLKIAYRSNNKLNAVSALKNNLQLLEADFLIFDGEEITGYPNNLKDTAALMRNNNLIFGNVEAFIAAQAGAEKLAKLNNYQLLRTHSMQQEEVEQSAPEEIINRYLLSVRERNVKLIYHKPYLKGNRLAERNFDLLSALTSELKAAGYQPGKAETVNYFSSSSWDLVAILLGVTAAGILLLNYFTAFKYSMLMNMLFLIAAAAAFLFLRSGQEILLRQITALGAAVIFPSLAVILFLLERSRGAENIKGVLGFSYLFFNFTAAVVTALIGGVFVSAALNSSDFIFKINNFRGVKVAFLMPLVIISLYYFFQSGNENLKHKIPRVLESVIKVKHLILAAGLAIIAVIYIGRTGNFPLLPVPAWELTIRSLLEKVLYVRPRFKEFLIGHPLFIFSLYLSADKRNKLCFYPLLMLASVGVVTTVNTFSHLHTPVMVSLLRTFHAYWLSFVVVSVIILVYKLANKLYQKYYFHGVK